jgi:hypothetical protein
MPLDSLDSVPEAQRVLYVEKGGQFAIDADEFARFKNFGLTPAEIADLIAEKRDAPEQLDKIIAQHEAVAAFKISTLETELADARALERDVLVNAVLATALCRAGATPAGVDLLTQHLGKRVVLAAANGKYSVQILQADGKTPMAGMTFADLMTEAAESWPSLFTHNKG